MTRKIQLKNLKNNHNERIDEQAFYFYNKWKKKYTTLVEKYDNFWINYKLKRKYKFKYNQYRHTLYIDIIYIDF